MRIIKFLTVAVSLLLFVTAYGIYRTAALEQPLADDAQADRIIVEKQHHSLTLMRAEKILKRYQVALGRNNNNRAPAGDRQIPDGLYYVAGRNPQSRFHLALNLKAGEPEQGESFSEQSAQPDGPIMIHGLRDDLDWVGPLHRMADWTAGNVAVTDNEIDEIGRAAADGTPVEIRP